jgi:hypothetical protein
MLDIAISMDVDHNGRTIAETDHGKSIKVLNWPQDSEYNLLVFTRDAKTAEVVSTEEVVRDIASALQTLRNLGLLKTNCPEWYSRLKKYASGASEL